MVVKILPSAASFAGVDYNEKRASEGEAELIAAKNFGNVVTFMAKGGKSTAAYKKYLQMWSETNSRIKNPQFHVVISCKGKEYSREALQRIGEEWLKGMGYGNNPYLIWFHKNTNNNHIHIVTSRVNGKGEKINHNYEKKRAVQCMDRIMGEDRKQNMRNDISAALRYSCSSVKQMAMVLESMGYKTKTEEDGVTVYSGADKVKVSKDLCAFCQGRYKKPQMDRKERVKNAAIISKYAEQLPREQFEQVMRRKFGLSFMFFGKKENPYGYCVIDRKNKRVIAGKDIIPVKNLVAKLGAEHKKTDFMMLVSGALDDNRYITSKQLAKLIGKGGGELKNGVVKSKFADEILYRLTDDMKKKLEYNDRLYWCMSKYKPATEAEREYLASRYKLSAMDIKEYPKISGGSNKSADILYYKTLLQDGMENGDLKGFLSSQGVEIQRLGDEFLFVDWEKDVAVSNETLGVGYDVIEESLSESRESYGEYYGGFSGGGETDESPGMSLLESLLSPTAGGPAVGGGGGGGTGRNADDDEKKKKKKKGLGR